MDFEPTAAHVIEGHHLTTWAVLPGGDQVCLSFAATDGGTHRIILPFNALTGIVDDAASHDAIGAG